MTFEELKKYYGTAVEMTRALGIGINAPQYWKKHGYIPYSAQLLIEKKTNGRFTAQEQHGKPVTKPGAKNVQNRKRKSR